MKPPKILGFAAAAAVVLMALIGVGTASATALTSPEGTVLKTGSTIHMVNSGTSTLTTTFKNITCSESTVQAKTTNESGTAISASVESLTWGGCNCEVKTLKGGTLSITSSGSGNGAFSSSNAEITVSCSTIFGNVHCIYATGAGTSLGTLTGSSTTGSTATLDVAETNIPRLATSAICAEKAHWDATYKVDKPDSLFIEGEAGGGPTSTSLTTSLSGEAKSGEEITINEGSKAKDTATLSGTNASKATGTVKYKVYADKECKELVTNAGEVTVSEGKVPASEEKELEAGRVYYWQAEYSGDANNLKSTSTCGKEVLTVKAKTSLTTSLSGEAKSGEEITILEGSKAKDTATLSGTKSSTATGKIKFRVYKDKECKELVSEAGEGSLSEGKASSEEKTLEAGTVYYWQAEYPGDSLHQASTSTCGKEVLAVKASTSLSTKLSGGGEEGAEVQVEEEDPVKDKATLSGTNASNATGTVKYNVYSDAECKELVTSAGEVTVSGGSVPASSEVALADGLYFWQASYSGDATHAESSSPCGSEVEVVAEETSLTTTLSSESGSGEEINVEEGGLAIDDATLTGTHAAEAEGYLRYSVYADAECNELTMVAGTVTVEEGSVPSSPPVNLPVGTYYWQARYFGDALNQEATSACGSEIENVEPTPLTTSLSGEGQSGTKIEVEEEAQVVDTATINEKEAVSATGTVQYAVYGDDECEELVAEAGEVSVIEGVVPASNEEALPAGSYYWQASYSGDLTHAAATSVCGTEVEVVRNATLISTTLSGGGKSGAEIEVTEGTSSRDQASLSGTNAATATGAVAYSVYSDGKCEDLVAHVGSVEVAEGVVPKSPEVELPVGTYYWQAEYFGDSSNQPAASACGSESEVVKVAALTNELSGGGEEGAEIEVEEEVPVTDTATLHEENVGTATGSVDYFAYADSECKELLDEAGTVTVSKGEIPASEAEALPEGTYYWKAVYSGDETHAAASTVCKQAIQNVNLPWIVSVGDSYIGGEGGRWAGNVEVSETDQEINALGDEAYTNPRNDEGEGEKIPLCHRSVSAEIFIQIPRVKSRNFACTGARVASYSSGTIIQNNAVTNPGEFKPGIDFADVAEKDPFPAGPGRCGLPRCKGQAKLLEEFAQTHPNIKMVVVSIGGNDFEFEGVVTACARAFIENAVFGRPKKECRNNEAQKKLFELKSIATREARIERAIENAGEALTKAGLNKANFTILVQDYPSPIPKEGAEIRYPENQERAMGGCPFWNEDAKWANQTALQTIDETVSRAAKNVALKYNVVFMEEKSAFDGRRLCENGLRLVSEATLPPRFPDWRTPGAVDETEWINQIRFPKQGSPWQVQESLHPNFWGQLALRNCLRQAYNGGAPKAGTCARKGNGLTSPPNAPAGWLPEPDMELK